MAHFVERQWANETVRVDGHQYDNCTFDRCVLQFRGVAPTGFRDCQLTNCRWSFVGNAATTLTFLSDLYQGFGDWGRNVVDSTFENVRRDAYRTPRPADEAEAGAPAPEAGPVAP